MRYQATHTNGASHFLPASWMEGLSVALLIVGLVVATAACRYALQPWLGESVPLMLFTVPVVLAARARGASAGGWTTLLSLILGVYLFVPMQGELSIAFPHDQVRVGLFLFVGLLISAFVGEVHESEVRLIEELRHRESVERRLRVTLAEVEHARRELEFYRYAMDQATLVESTSSDGKILHVNDGFCQASGYSREELLGQTHRLLNSHYHPRSFFRKMYETITKGHVWRAEIRNRRKDGAYFWVDSTIVPFVLADGTIDRYVVIRHDITRLKAAEESLRDADRKKDEFLATLAHELRNPLAPIKNAVAILRQEPSDVGVRNRLRDMIGRQVDQMTRLIDDLLDVSRIAAGKVELKTEVLDVRPLVEQALESTRPLIDKKRHSVSVEMPDHRALVRVDPTRCNQIMSNILSNAAKYTDDGGRIWVKVVADGECVSISVKDHGIGLAREMQPRVFDLFTQADPTSARSTGGLGIGLMLVRRLTEMHGGTVSVSSEGLGRGSEFTVRLKQVADDEVSKVDGTVAESLNASEPERNTQGDS